MPSEKYIIGLVIAVACIAIFFGAVKLLYDSRVNQESENAKNVLDSIVAKISILQDGQSAEQLVQGFENSENWYIAGFNVGEVRPNKCLLNNCICICKLDGFTLNCQTKGFCRDVTNRSLNVSSKLLREYSIYVSDGKSTGVSLNRDNSNLGYVRLSKKLISLIINKGPSEVGVKTTYGPFNSQGEDWVSPETSVQVNPRSEFIEGYIVPRS